MKNRLGALVCTTSIGPGATNMVTGAALATVNRLPVLLLPGDVFASRRPDPVLQQLETPWAGDVSVNDCFRPVSRYFDRISRPEQVIRAALQAMRVLVEPGRDRRGHARLPAGRADGGLRLPRGASSRSASGTSRGPCPTTRRSRARSRRSARRRRPLIVAGGGVIYSRGRPTRCARFCEQTGIPVGETQAGQGLAAVRPPIRARRDRRDRHVRREPDRRASADLVIGIGTRWRDFTTASKTAFRAPRTCGSSTSTSPTSTPPSTRALALVGDARATLERLAELLAGWSVDDAYRAEAAQLNAEWDAEVSRLYALGHGPLPAQSEVIGAVNAVSAPADVVVCAAGAMPGDLHKLWRTRDPKGYHVEYGYSCMGYEIAGGLGVKLAAPEREVYVLVGDGSYLMLSSELVTAVQEGLKLTIVLVDNHGYNSIGALSRSLGTDGFGTQYRYRRNGSLGVDSERLDRLPPHRPGGERRVARRARDPRAARSRSSAPGSPRRRRRAARR